MGGSPDSGISGLPDCWIIKLHCQIGTMSLYESLVSLLMHGSVSWAVLDARPGVVGRPESTSWGHLGPSWLSSRLPGWGEQRDVSCGGALGGSSVSDSLLSIP